MKLKQDDIINVLIVDQGMDGEGIAKLDDYIIFVPYALIGEKVQVKVTYVKRNLVFGNLVTVITQCDDRTMPVCNRFTRCGGCDLLHQDYDAQLKWKKKKLEIILRKNAGITMPVKDVVPSECTLRYRNKIQLPFGIVNNKVAMGFYRPNSHKIVSITKCFLHGEWAEKLMGIFISYANENNVSVYNEITKKGILRHMVARNLDGKLSIVVVTNNSPLPKIKQLISKLDDCFKGDYALYYCPKKLHNNVVMGEKIIPIVGLVITTDILGVKVEVNPYSFLQLNNEIRDKIYNTVIDHINANCPISDTMHAKNIVIDAYAGVGIMGAVLAKNGAYVYNIEIVKQATYDADKLATSNNLTSQITNINGDAEIELPKLVKKLLESDNNLNTASSANENSLNLDCNSNDNILNIECKSNEKNTNLVSDAIDNNIEISKNKDDENVESIRIAKHNIERTNTAKGLMLVSTETPIKTTLAPQNTAISCLNIILDPPRKGCSVKVINALNSIKAPHNLYYISCNPSTLSRDLKLLNTYKINTITPFDMFPNTKHLETLVCLTRK